MGPSNKLSCEAGSFSCHLNPHRFFYLVRGVEALFSCTGTLGCMVCLALQLFLPVYLQANVGLTAAPAATSLCPPAITLPTLVLQLLPCHKSSPPYCPSLDECLFFKKEDFHTVQFYGSSGYFFFLNLLSSLFLFCEGAKCIHPCLHLGWKSLSHFDEKKNVSALGACSPLGAPVLH